MCSSPTGKCSDLLPCGWEGSSAWALYLMQLGQDGPRLLLFLILLHLGLQPLVILESLFAPFHCHVQTGKDATEPAGDKEDKRLITAMVLSQHLLCWEFEDERNRSWTQLIFFLRWFLDWMEETDIFDVTFGWHVAFSLLPGSASVKWARQRDNQLVNISTRVSSVQAQHSKHYFTPSLLIGKKRN